MKLNNSRSTLMTTLVIAMLSIVSPAQAVLMSGNTNASTPTTIDTFLTFAGSTFTNVNVPTGAGPTSLPNLGVFTLNVCGSVNCSEPFGSQDGISDFTLKITFTDPTVAGTPQLFTADIFGTINRSGNSNNIGSGSLLTIDFDNTAQHLTYTNASGSGSFDLSVNDPASYTAASQFGDTRTVTGQITNLTFTAGATDGSTTAVPEPASIGLVLLGLGGIAARLRQHIHR